MPVFPLNWLDEFLLDGLVRWLEVTVRQVYRNGVLLYEVRVEQVRLSVEHLVDPLLPSVPIDLVFPGLYVEDQELAGVVSVFAYYVEVDSFVEEYVVALVPVFLY